MPRSKLAIYILQFLWRDLTSSFDVVGPYFTSNGPLESKSKSHLYQFFTCVMVCDGASSNVSAIKSFCGVSGAYAISSDKDDKHAIQPWFSNPFDPERKVFWVICPSHQVSI